MVTCVAQQVSSTEMSTGNYSRKLLRAATYDSTMPAMTCRKRLLSEQNEEQDVMMKFSNDDIYSNKRSRIESFDNDSSDNNKNNNQCHVQFFSSLSCFENTNHCVSVPYYQRRKSFTYINNDAYPSLITVPYPSTTTKNMLVCQQNSAIENDNNNENEREDKTNSSIFVTSAELSAYMTTIMNNRNDKLLIIDCGSPLRYNERRIKDSFLLNINDKLSRKRLINRGLKNFLDANQLNRLDQSEIIVLYDDSIGSCSSSCGNSSSSQEKLSSIIKCIFDEIIRYDSNKTIYSLRSAFDEFYQHYPALCYLSSSNLSDHQSPLPSPTIDLETYDMSEILSGLYLGNARDAKDRNLLEQNQIKSIINISTTIPCYYEHESSLFDYLQLKCNDSSQENILQYFDRTFEYIHQKLLANENILVHCQGGISRSPSFIIGYLMKCHSKTFDQAYLIVKDKRKIINPNLNFLAQLTRYEQLLTTTTAMP